MKIVRRTAALGAVAAVAALAAQPAAAAPPSPTVTQPPPMCFESPQFAVCSTDVGPLAQRAMSDPVGTAEWTAAVAEYIACYGQDVCSGVQVGG